MLTLRKLSSLPEGTARRKTLVLIREFETDLAAERNIDRTYLNGLIAMVAQDGFWPDEVRKSAETLLPSQRSLNTLRHAMLKALGRDWADWDKQIPGDAPLEVSRSNLFARARPVRVYLEGLRSPFNVGSIARTALAFGMERLWCSRDCASPEHHRARRSAMGALTSLSWDVAELENLNPEETGSLFALELGGTALGDFQFPESGTVILGSEELGVSPELMARAKNDGGVVSIPLPGPKASLNVGVAFGILVQKWVEAVG